MRHLRTLPVALLLAATALALSVLAGCAGNTPKAAKSTPSATTSSTASAAKGTSSAEPTEPSAPSPTTPATPSDRPAYPRDRIEAASLHTAVLESNAAKTAEEKAVVDAWMAFWQGTADTYYFYRPTKTFDAVARKSARTAILTYLDGMKKQRQRVVGWAKDNVTEVKVTGNRATVRDCTENFTFRVDEEIEPLSLPTPYYDATGTLEKVDGRWTVVRQDSKELTKSCLS